jgi:gliding motility-associated-like protein
MKQLIFTLFVVFGAALQAAMSQGLDVVDATTPPFDPVNLINTVFLGDGVEITQVTFKGQPVAVGYFTGGQGTVGLERGIVLTTGRASTSGTQTGASGLGENFANTNNNSAVFDVDLAAQVLGATLHNVAVYEISFIPTADTLRFRYVFASEEYPEFACSPFNDIFGFFIQGPGYPMPTNIARIPGTTLPVTINNLHPDNNQPGQPCPAVNAQYYVNNNNSKKQPVYDGYTTVFTAEAIVQPCQPYTIKLAIADVSDPQYDSGVFLEAKSFGTGSVKVDIATASLEGVVAEGCSAASITFTLPSPSLLPFTINCNIFGTATNGVDYAPIPQQIVLMPGERSITLPIIALEDGLTEGDEFIGFSVQRDPCNLDTFIILIRDNLLLAPKLPEDTDICLPALPLTLNGTVPVAVQPPPVFSNDNDLSIQPDSIPVFSSITVSGVLPLTMGPKVLRSVCMNITHPWVDDLDIFLIAPNGQFLELTTDNGGNGKNYTNTCFSPKATVPISFPGPTAPPSSAPFTGDWLPEGPFSDLWGSPTNGTWQLRLVDDSKGFNGTLRDWSITFEPIYTIQYAWSPAAGLSCTDCSLTEALPVVTTTYTVEATDAYGCVAADSILLSVFQSLPAPVVNCFNTSIDSVVFNWLALPGATGYEVNVDGAGWQPVGTDTFFVVDGLFGPSIVSLEVRGIPELASCTAEVAEAICFNCTAPDVGIQVVDVRCFQESSGSVQLTPSSGAPPFVFSLNDNLNQSGLFTGLPAGTYRLRVLSADGCLTEQFIYVGEPPPVEVSITAIAPPSCFGAADGVVAAAAAGGLGTLSLTWSNGASGTPVSGVDAGIIRVVATDSFGCEATDSLLITQPDALVTSIAVQEDIRCFGDANGRLQAAASGGSPPYSITWNDGASSTLRENLTAGTYAFTLTDTNGCTASDAAAVTEPSPLVVAVQANGTNCDGGGQGRAEASPSGGTPGYTFQWSNGGSGAAIDALSAGMYTVTVTDGNGCTVVATTTIFAQGALVVAIQTTDIDCFGASTGKVDLDISGGLEPYTVAWTTPSGPGQGISLEQLPAGAFSFTVTDAQGCEKTDSIRLMQPENPLTTGLNAVADTVCSGSDGGRATAAPAGGTAPYNFSWSTGATTEAIDELSAGTYSLTISDSNGCQVSAATAIAEQAVLSLVLGSTGARCHLSSDGQAQVVAAFYGAQPVPTGSLSYVWNTNPPQNGPLASGLRGRNTYQVTATDNRGCRATDSISVGAPDPFQLSVLSVDAPRCFGEPGGKAILAATGGQPPYTYAWGPGPATVADSLATGLLAGIYTVTITDILGCSSTSSVSVPGAPALSVQFTRQDVVCFGESSGIVGAQTVGGIPPYTYAWSNGQTGASLSGLAAGLYRVTVTDGAGCTREDAVAVLQPGEPLNGIVLAQNPSCPGGFNGSISIEAIGGTPPYQYSIDGSRFTGAPVQIALVAGTYTPALRDARGCTTMLPPVTLQDPPPLVVDLGPDINLLFGRDTQLLARVTNNQGPVFFQWQVEGAPYLSCVNCPDPVVQGLDFGRFFQVTVTDSAGCRASDALRIDVEKPRGVYVPTGFSPNGDGQNDRLLVHGQPGTRVRQLTIYDRWGEIVYLGADFEVNDPIQGWDGTFRGQPCDPGVFVWVLEVVYPDGFKDVLRGNTALLR